jgi:hypothetical protein
LSAATSLSRIVPNCRAPRWSCPAVAAWVRPRTSSCWSRWRTG